MRAQQLGDIAGRGTNNREDGTLVNAYVEQLRKGLKSNDAYRDAYTQHRGEQQPEQHLNAHVRTPLPFARKTMQKARLEAFAGGCPALLFSQPDWRAPIG
jgi:hypothetical protein